MLLFSTILNINDTMTPDSFIQLVIDWNQNDPHPEAVIPGIIWNGERNIRYGNERFWLDIQEYSSRDIIAIRYEKPEAGGKKRDTDYVMNFREMKISIRQTLNGGSESGFREEKLDGTPYFISMLIEQDYLKTDQELPVLDQPIYITEDNINLIGELLSGRLHCELPVILVSRTASNRDPVDIARLARRSRGAAHVLVEENRNIGKKIRQFLSGRNDYRAAIGIYYPGGSEKKQFFRYHRTRFRRQLLLKEIVDAIIRYNNSRTVDTLYTWEGVSHALINDRVKENRSEKEAAVHELEELLELMNQELNQLNQRVNELTTVNQKLSLENTRLKGSQKHAEKLPVLYLGSEEEFFYGEIRELLLSTLSDSLKNIKPRSRRSDVIHDILHSNEYTHLYEQNHKEIKTLLKGYRTMNGPLRQKLTDLGFVITEEGKHYNLTYYGDDRYWTSIPKTGSDSREGKNMASMINNLVF